VEKVFPGVLEKLKQVLVAEASEKESQA
jgi:hypothetical protein